MMIKELYLSKFILALSSTMLVKQQALHTHTHTHTHTQTHTHTHTQTFQHEISQHPRLTFIFSYLIHPILVYICILVHFKLQRSACLHFSTTDNFRAYIVVMVRVMVKRPFEQPNRIVVVTTTTPEISMLCQYHIHKNKNMALVVG